MTLDDVRKAIAEIRHIGSVKFDNEDAHAKEDVLYEQVLESIADETAEDPREMARLALATREIEFTRHCA
jgi:hypothetical protein